jgi:hypothetical protein
LLLGLPRNLIVLPIRNLIDLLCITALHFSLKVAKAKRVIDTPAVYPRIVEFLHFNVQSTGQKSLCVKAVSGHHKAMFLLNS